MPASLLYRKSIVSIRDLRREQIDQILDVADKLDHKRGVPGLLSDKILYVGTDEPSSRTIASFCASAIRLGMPYYSVSDAGRISSFAKGESISDSTRVDTKYFDLVVFRHKQPGSMQIMLDAIAKERREVNRIPLVSAGEADIEHPTQGLLDALTFRQKLRRLDNLVIALAGDCKHSRTIRSLVFLLGLYHNIHLIFVSPPHLRMKDDLRAFLNLPTVQARGITFVEVESLEDVVYRVDALYMTRAQKERHSDLLSSDVYLELTLQLAQRMRHDSIITHPLPRNSEIAVEVDALPQAVYLEEQLENGMRVRMACIILTMLEQVPPQLVN